MCLFVLSPRVNKYTANRISFEEIDKQSDFIEYSVCVVVRLVESGQTDRHSRGGLSSG